MLVEAAAPVLSVLVPDALVPVLVPALVLVLLELLGVEVVDIVELAGSVVVVVVVVVVPVPDVVVEFRLPSVVVVLDDDGVALRLEPVPLVFVEVELEVSELPGVVPLVVPVAVPLVPVLEVWADAPMAHTRAAAAAARVRLEDSLVIAFLL